MAQILSKNFANICFATQKEMKNKSSLFILLVCIAIFFMGVNLQAQPTPGGVSNPNYSWGAWLTPESYNSSGIWINQITTSGTFGNFNSLGTAPAKGATGYNFHQPVYFTDQRNRLQSANNVNIANGENVTVILVMQRNTQANTYQRVLSFNASNNTNQVFYYNDNGPYFSWNSNTYFPTSAAAGLSFPNGETGLYVVSFTNTAVNDRLQRYVNGTLTSSGTTGITPGANNNRLLICSQDASGSNGFNGTIHELIILKANGTNNHINYTDIQQINSYLCIKYGMMLNNTDNYVVSGTIVWNRTTNNGYNNYIFGIGCDHDSQLNQVQSRNKDDGKVILYKGVYNAINDRNSSALADKTFVMLGSNNASKQTVINLPAGTPISGGILGEKLNFRTNLIYKAQITGASQIVSMKLSLSQINLNAKYVMVSNDPTFSNPANIRFYPISKASPLSNADNILINNGDYISFGGYFPTPGGINMNGYTVDLWVDGDNATANSWVNFADANYSLENFGSTATAVQNSTKFNFHQEINFGTNANAKLRTTANYTQTAGESYHYFIVSDATVGTLGTNAALLSFNNSGTNANANTTLQWHSANTDILSARWNGTNLRTFGFDSPPNSKYGIITMNLLNVATTGQLQMYLNGRAGTTITGANLNATNNVPLVIGGTNHTAAGTTNPFNGTIQEIILIRRSAGAMMPADTIAKINSYLAIKYGITLSSGNYVNSAGTIVWNRTTNNGYTSAIFGIGRDDEARLNQVQSRSAESNLIALYKNTYNLLNDNNSNDLADKTFVMLGSNNLSRQTVINFPIGATVGGGTIGSTLYEKLNFRTNLIYKAQVTGGTQTVNMKLLLSEININAKYVMVSNDPTFSNPANIRFYPIANALPLSNAYNIVINNGEYISFGGYFPTPGGINMNGYNLDLWVDGDNVSDNSWTNFAHATYTLENFGSTATTVQNSRFNFHKEINLGTNDNAKLHTTANYTQTAGESYHYFIVSDATVGTLGTNAALLSFNNSGTNATPNTSLQWSSNTPNILSANWNGTNVRNFGFSSSSNSRYGIITMNLLNVATTGQLQTYLNGTAGTLISGTNLNATNNIPLVIGGTNHTAAGTTNPFNGTIQEIILIRRSAGAMMPADTIAKINSYLAIKYGITLNSGNYVNSAGTIVWNRTTNVGYTSAIFGIGRDDESGLNQVQSRSIESNIITLYKGPYNILNNRKSNELADKTFIIFGSNNVSGMQSYNVPINEPVSGGTLSEQLNYRTNLIYKAQLTGGSQTVNMRLTSINPNTRFVMVSSTNTFTPLTTRYYAITKLAVDLYNVNFVLINNGDFISFAGFEPRPGGVNMAGYTLDLWVDGDHSTNNSWTNLATSSYTLERVGAMPTPLVQNPMNYHNGLYFGNNARSKLRTNTGYDIAAATSYHTFVVSENTQTGESTLLTFNPTNSDADARRVCLQWNNKFTRANWQTSSTPSWGTALTTTQYSISSMSVLNGAGTNGGKMYQNSATTGFVNFNAASVINNSVNRLIVGNGSQNDYGSGNGTDNGNRLPFNGTIHEVIVMRGGSSQMPDADIQKIHSYLAIKYGITLNTGNTQNNNDYLASNGAVVWSRGGANATYNNNIFGIGRDENSGLYQKQARSATLRSFSVFIGSNITTLNSENDGKLSDMQYLMIGADGNDPLKPLTGIAPNTHYLNGIAATDLIFDLQSPTFKTQLTGMDSIWVRMEAPSKEFSYVLVSKYNNFDTLFTMIYPVTKRLTDRVKIDTAFKYFKFIGFEAGPGGIPIGLMLWLRADNEASLKLEPVSGRPIVDGGDPRVQGYPYTSYEDINNLPAVVEWKDLLRGHTYTHVDATVSTLIPVYRPNSPEMNYHPAIRFWYTGSSNATTAWLENASGVGTSGNPGTHSAIFLTNSDFRGSEPRVYALLFSGTAGSSSSGVGLYQGPGYGVERVGSGRGRFRTYSTEINGNQDLFRTGSTTILSYYQQNNNTITFRFNGVENNINSTVNWSTETPGFHRRSLLGMGYNYERCLKGVMSEAILYNRELTSYEKTKVESYMALKYGITLEPNVSTHRFNYTLSDSTIIWEGDQASGKYVTFYNNIAAVVRDDAAELNNTHSHSTNVGSILHLGVAGTELSNDGSKVGSLKNNFEAIIFGNTNATSVTTIVNADACGDFSHRFDRIWLVHKVTQNNRPIAMLVGAQDNAGLTIGDDPVIEANYYANLRSSNDVYLLVADSPADIVTENYKAVVPMSIVNGEFQCSYLFTEEDTYLTFGYKSNNKGCTGEVNFPNSKVFRWTQYTRNTNTSPNGGLTIPPLASPFPAVNLGDNILVAPVHVIYGGTTRATTRYPRSVNTPTRGSLEVRRSQGSFVDEVTTTITFNHPVIPEFSITGLDGRSRSRDRVEISGTCASSGSAVYYPDLLYDRTRNRYTTYVIRGNVAEVLKNTAVSATNRYGRVNVEFNGSVTDIQIKWRLNNRISGTQRIFITPISMIADPPPPVINEDGLSFTQQATPQEVALCRDLTYTYRIGNINCEDKKVNFSVTLPAGMKWFANTLSIDSVNIDTTTVIHNYNDIASLIIDNLVVKGAQTTIFRAKVYFDMNATDGAYTNRAQIDYLRIDSGIVIPISFKSDDRLLGPGTATTVTALPAYRIEPLEILDFSINKECYTARDTLQATLTIRNPNFSAISDASVDVSFNEEFTYITNSLNCPTLSSVSVEPYYEGDGFTLEGPSNGGFAIPSGIHTITFRLIAPNVLENEYDINEVPLLDEGGYPRYAPLNVDFGFFSLSTDDECADAAFWNAYGEIQVAAKPQLHITGNTAICIGDTSHISRWIGGKCVSNNPSVAVVDATGKITGISGGQTTFTFIPDNLGVNCAPISETLTVYPPTLLTSSDTLPTICTRGRALYVPTCAVGGATFHWERQTTEGITEPANSGNGNINEVLTNTSSYPIQVIYTIYTTASGCTSVQNVTIMVTPKVVPSVKIKKRH